MRRWLPLFTITMMASLGACRSENPFGDGSDSGAELTETVSDSGNDDDIELECIPGEVRCGDESTVEVCAGTGLDWEPEACGPYEVCMACADDDPDCDGAVCAGPCELAAETPSSAGCSFLATRVLHELPDPNSDPPPPEGALVDGLVVGNPNPTDSATVQLYRTPVGKLSEEPVGRPVLIAAGDSTTFNLDSDFILGESSLFRTGGNFRVQSNLPVVVYQHAPLQATFQNDSSMLLPESTLGQSYVAASYGAQTDGLDNPDFRPSYFVVIATVNGTTVEWTPPQNTAGDDLTVPSVEAGATGSKLMNRFDTMRVVASRAGPPEEWDFQDVSGTVITADHPIWVVGATRCGSVPANVSGCDHLQEQLIPIEMWGTKYVGPHSPTRGDEDHIWRVYAGDDGITVTTDPPIPNTPVFLENRGDFVELVDSDHTNTIFEADGPIMPVQYLTGRENTGLANAGDPAMYQMVPVEQYLGRYAFVTALGFNENFVQVIRELDGAEVRVDGSPVAGWEIVVDYEVATVSLDEGLHTAESDGNFGLLQIGYGLVENGARTSYAYPGGMKAEVIYIP